jgi:crotonobetainyl-CoA:carnitine CoA-transferase CaiB-like acyl-CoA transferase
MDMLRQNSEELISILDEIFATKTREEWEPHFKENIVIYGLVQSPMEVTQDPQALANDFFAELDNPTLGKIKVVTLPMKFHQNPASVRTPAPERGQHSEEILLDLGYSWEDIGRLKEQEVIL